MLQVGGQLLAAHAVVGRSLGLPDGVAAQRQGLGGGQTALVALDGIHQIPRLVVDLEHSPLQQRTGRQAVGGVVVGGLLDNLDLGGNGGVLPVHQGHLARLDVDGFHLGVRHIPRIFQLPQVIASAVCQALDIHIALVVRGVLPDGPVRAVIEQEGHSVEPLASGAAGFVNQNT